LSDFNSFSATDYLTNLKLFDHNQVPEVTSGWEHDYVHIFSSCCNIWHFSKTKHPRTITGNRWI